MDFVAEPERDRRVSQRTRPPADTATEHPGRDHAGATARVLPRLSPGAVMAMQRHAGNRAVSRLVASRRTSSGAAKPGLAAAGSRTGPSEVTSARAPSGPVVQLLADGAAAGRAGPGADPKFTALKRDVQSKQQLVGRHPPPASEVSAAQGAAKPPQDDKEAQGKTANAEKMNAAKPGEFDKAAFIKAVNDAIAKQAPKNLDEADKFGDSGKADAVQGEVRGQVGAGRETSAKAIETSTAAPPDTSAAKEKQVTPLRPDQPPPTPGTPHADQAVPDRAPASATDFSAGPQQVDQQMADAQVTEEQLAKSNEPEFTGALQEKKAGERQAATSPGEVRAGEAKTLAGAKAQAAQTGAAAMTAMSADRTRAGKEVGAGKEATKGQDESKRAQVTATLQKVFDVTKKDVEDILNGLDKKVDDKFSSGEKAARDAFTADYTRRINDYKDKRYSGFWGPARWIKDKLLGMPGEVNAFYEQARQGYVNRMQGVISSVADVIGTELGRAKARIAKGRAELQAEVKKLPADLQAIGKQAAGEFAGKFDELTEQVNDKGTQLVDTLASKYTEALKAVDEQIAAEKEKNKGLIAKVVAAVKGVIDTIIKLKDLLLGVLAKAAQAVVAIIKDPIGFLGKLISGVGAGLKAFMANIASHLQKGLVSWLLGAAAKAGLQLPEKFDLKGILLLIGSLLGLTWASIRGRVVSRGIPEQAMTAVEASVPEAQKIKNEGLGGVWEQLKEKVGDLKATLLGRIAEYLIPTVIIAGITWIISLLNPASAFIKACKAIIDIVGFIIDRGAQIIAFVNAVLDAVIAIAGGGVGGVPGLIETALATALPVLIGFLAALLGIGGLADKVKKLFQSLSKPVMKAVDWIVGKIVAFGKKIWAKLKAKLSRDGKGKDGELTPKQKEKISRQAANEAYRAATGVPVGEIPGALDGVLTKWRPKGVKSLEVVPLGNHYFTVQATVNPTTRAQAKAMVDIAPEQLSMEQVSATSFASSTTAASGVFSADSSAEVTEIMKSGAAQRELKLTDSQQGAHAEEQVVNKFHVGWNDRVENISANLPAGRGNVRGGRFFQNSRMVINVSKSSCINCASYIVSFVKKLRERSSSVKVAMKFASLYHGAQDVSKSNMDDSGRLIRLFVEKARLKETSRLGRIWGPASLIGGRQETVTEVDGTKGAGKAGLAILRNAGIDVDILSKDDVEGAGDEEQRGRLDLRNRKLREALEDVEQKLDIKKG